VLLEHLDTLNFYKLLLHLFHLNRVLKVHREHLLHHRLHLLQFLVLEYLKGILLREKILLHFLQTLNMDYHYLLLHHHLNHLGFLDHLIEVHLI
tara:strand:+ start:223 stop:504 length:282 start_codon:yes stop_codon:yes gene_type:complete